MCRWFLVLLICVSPQSLSAQTSPNDPEYDTMRPPVREERDTPVVVSTRNFNVMTTRNGRAEFVAIGPRRDSNAAIRALVAAGGQVLRRRPLPRLDLEVLVFDLQRLPLAAAQRTLALATSETIIEPHNIYRFASGQPRLYAAGMLGLTTPGACQVPQLRIGMIDGPVDTSHPSLSGVSIHVQSALAEGETPVSADHGTAVAALMVGQDAEGALTGFASGAQLFAVTTFAREKRGPGTDINRIGAALDVLLAQRAQLINMSFAGPPNAALNLLLDAAAKRGAILVAAVGNDRRDSAAWPAAAPSVIAVTAVDAAGRRYRAANTGAEIEFAAPGVDLYVAKRRSGTYASGTSYAAPILTALAARHVARGATSANDLRQRLRSGVSDLGSPGRDTSFGWGLVQAPDC